MSGFDFSELEEYASKIDNLAHGIIEKEYLDAANIIAKKFAKDVAKRTSHVSGVLQGAWKYRVFKAQGNEYIILVWNPIEYAEYVENGHRQEVGRYIPAIGKRLVKPWIEGQFMMKTTQEEIEELMPNVAANIERKLRELLDG